MIARIGGLVVDVFSCSGRLTLLFMVPFVIFLTPMYDLNFTVTLIYRFSILIVQFTKLVKTVQPYSYDFFFVSSASFSLDFSEKHSDINVATILAVSAKYELA